jgi:hypothetical protein
MIKVLIGVLILNIGIASDRIQRDSVAKTELENLNFFTKGRGMVISPDLINMYEILKKTGIGLSTTGILNQRWGLNLLDKEVKGLFNVPYKKMNMGVLGCVACHSGRAAGQWIIGLGNKNIDVGQVGKDAYLAELIWGMAPRPTKPEFREIHNRALAFTKILKNDNINNLTQGLVPTSLVKTWFYEINEVEIPRRFGRGQVKVPHLWGYGEKRKSGSFWDGFADGVYPGWAVAVELRGGQSVENVRGYVDKVHHAEDLLGDLLPPKYPFEIDQIKASRGQQSFGKFCIKCHGEHLRDENNLPIFKESKVIPWKYVKTDYERLEFVTDEFLSLIDSSPLNDLMKYKDRDFKGYVAPRLWGIWSRFPYLHNGSIPTLRDLFNPKEDRPVVFNLHRAGELDRYDPINFGLKVNRDIESRDYKKMLKSAKRGKRNLYYTKRMGHGNQGHEFGFFRTMSDSDKTDLIEYLKTL